MFGLTTMFRQNKFGKKTTCGSLTMVPKRFGDFKKALENCTGQVPKLDWSFFLGCFSMLFITVCPGQSRQVHQLHKATAFSPVFGINDIVRCRRCCHVTGEIIYPNGHRNSSFDPKMWIFQSKLCYFRF